MNFSEALSAMKEGRLMQRAGWNGKGMFVFHRPQGEAQGSIIPVDKIPFVKSIPDVVKGYHIANNIPMQFLPEIMMFTADKKLVSWLISQTDQEADDWQDFRID